MFLDKEENIMDMIQGHHIELYNFNSLTRKVRRCIKDLSALTNNSGHDQPPPDYYSDKYNIMFDVMRVNDSEITKGNNPVLKRERKITEEFKNANHIPKENDVNLFIIPDLEHYDKEHTFEYYKNNCQRVIEKHIKDSKLQIWEKEHPNIKNKGILIFDETECYFQGLVKRVSEDSDIHAFIPYPPLTLHKPWEDKDFIEITYQAKIDFVVWVCLYKAHSTICVESRARYPEIMVLDVRKPRKDYKEYRYDLMVCS